MKQVIKAILSLAVLISLLPSCKKSNGGNEVTNGNNFSDSIRNIVPQQIIDSLRNWGMKINDGLTPPSIAGIYLENRDSCEFDNSGGNYTGRIFDSYKFRFSNQDKSKLTLEMDIKDVGYSSDNASDSSATFISGSGNRFTIFAQEKGVESGIGYTELAICSGEISAAGILNFQYSIYLKNKVGDPYNAVLMSVGSSRIFTNADGPAVPAATFSIEPNSNIQSPAPLFMLRSAGVLHPSLQ